MTEDRFSIIMTVLTMIILIGGIIGTATCHCTNHTNAIIKEYEVKIKKAEPGDQVVLYSNQGVILEKYLNKGWKIVLKDRGSTVIEKER